MILTRERTRQATFDHVVRLRPDLVLPHTLAPQVGAHIKHGGASGTLATKVEAAHTVPMAEMSQRLPAMRPIAHRSQTHNFGDDYCLRMLSASGRFCQFKCGEAEPERNSSLQREPSLANILTIPPFTPQLMQETFVNDVFWVVDRAHAPSLFDHLTMLSTWAHASATGLGMGKDESSRGGWFAQQKVSPPLGTGTSDSTRHSTSTVSATTDSRDDGAVGGACGSAMRPRAAPRCSDARLRVSSTSSSGSSSTTGIGCTTGGHECMITHSIVEDTVKMARLRAKPEAEPSSLLRVRYLELKKWAPYVLRLADSDPFSCREMQQAYACSEKRKVRRSVDSSEGQRQQPINVGASREVPNQGRPCRSADLLRKVVHTREGQGAARADRRASVRRQNAPHDR